MNKCFGIGLARTASKSLARALKQLGYKVAHYPSDAITASEAIAGRPFSILERCDALLDLHATTRYRELDAQYPGSRFILTTREKTSWLRSIREHFEFYHAHPEPQPSASMTATLHRRAYGADAFEEARFSKVYDDHYQAVCDHFAGRDNLLLLNIVAGEGWNRLCPFLGQPIPDRPFPRTR